MQSEMLCKKLAKLPSLAVSIPGVPRTLGKPSIINNMLRVDEPDGGYLIAPFRSIVRVDVVSRNPWIECKPEGTVRSLPGRNLN